MCSRGEKRIVFFLAVHPEYRKKGVAKRLTEKMTEWFTVEILFPSLHSKTATQKGYLPGVCYHACGFADDEKLTVFEYPLPEDGS